MDIFEACYDGLEVMEMLLGSLRELLLFSEDGWLQAGNGLEISRGLSLMPIFFSIHYIPLSGWLTTFTE